MDRTEIRQWVEDNTERGPVHLTPEELDHVAMCMDHLYQHYQGGRPVGDFLTAVVANDLDTASFRADDTNRKALYLYAMFMVNKVPLNDRWSKK